MTVQDTGEGPAPETRRSWRRWIVALAVLAIIAIVVASGLKVHKFVSHDQKFCVQSCHAPKDGSPTWHTKGHEGIECQECHKTPVKTSWSLLWKKTISSKNLPKHGKSDVAQCTHCHEKKPVEWREIEATEGHRDHRGVKDVDCLSCHGEFTHSKESPGESLCTAKCHDNLRLHKETVNAETCMQCHSFSASARLRAVRKPLAVVCKNCHSDAAKMAAKPPPGHPDSMKVFTDETVHGGLNCKLCHDPHGRKPTIPEGQPVCARCHQFDLLSIDAFAKGPKEHKECNSCHVPHASRKLATARCAQCHEKQAVKTTATTGPSTALKHTSCASCHTPHTWKAEKDGCVKCHEQVAHTLTVRSPPQHGTCTNCHAVHGPPPTGAVCVNCHAKTKRNHVARAPAKHKDCTSCHTPHAPDPKEAATACAKCHAPQTSGMVRGPAGHSTKGCVACHQSHEDPKPQMALCSKCHAKQVTLVATAPPPKHKACASCHEPHVFASKSVSATCMSCHGATAAGKSPKAADAAVIDPAGPHKGDCKSCHAPHGPPAVPKAACFSCHNNIQTQFVAFGGTHSLCQSCHQAHKPAAVAKARCATCHQPAAASAAKWPAASTHAKGCENCHQPHNTKAVKQCFACHDKQAKSAAGGKHKCAQCHHPHKDPPGTGAAWWTKCNDCHAPQVAAVKGRGPKHSDCKSCHQPHAFAVPACASCHTGIQSKALHAVPQHNAKCNACHDAHAKSSPTAAQCLSCHQNMKNHQPGAKTCQGCHLFN